MTKSIYLRSVEDKDNEWWKNLLIDADLWYKLINDNVIIKKGSYYPRIKDSNKRGLNAFLEVCTTYFKNTDRVFLMGVCKLKVCPQVYLNTLQINVDDENKHGLSDYLKEYKLEKSDIPFNAIVCNQNIMPSEKKLQTINEMIDNLEFTPVEIAKLINELSNQLISIYQ
tara:strand:+ start:1060 stop:1566 length:507 start_codon:yes stop_codon:yes gene_type:complete